MMPYWYEGFVGLRYLRASPKRGSLSLIAGIAIFGLALGVAATVAANVFYGLPFGWLAAVVSAWPATAFIGSVEMAVRFVSDARSVATGEAEDGIRRGHAGTPRLRAQHP